MPHQKRDPEIHQDVRAELWTQEDEGSRSVEISVHHGVVYLTGLVESYAEKWAIGRAVRHRRRQGPARLSPRAPLLTPPLRTTSPQFRSSAAFKRPQRLGRRMMTVRRASPSQALTTNRVRDGMQGFTSFAAHLVPGLLVIGLASFGRPCVAQEVDAPGASTGSGSVFAPSGWLELIAPVHERIALKAYGFYIGDLKTPVAQVRGPCSGDKVSDHYSQLHVLLGSCQRAQ